jgi:cytochrome c
MNKIQSLLAVISLLATPAVFADAKLAEKNACMACHAVDAKKLGPAYKAVAAKYATDKEAIAKLTASIKAGGSGKWGAIPMPAQAALSEADAKTLAAWIMTIK